MSKKLDRYEFIWKAIQVHGYKYDYSKVNYVSSKKEVCIICKKHGEFWQKPNNHLNKHGCPKCGGVGRLNAKEFVKQAKKTHGNRYDYSKVNYINISTKVCIICPEHGEFWQVPNNHINLKQGCPKCANKGVNEKGLYSTSEFLIKANKIHGDKYDYSKVNYKNSQTKVCIICPEHGEFYQKPNAHLRGNGCHKCSGKFLDRDFFIEKSKIIHNNKYDYSKVDYQGNKTKVCIICRKHGEFWQKPNGHLCGEGCPTCNESKLEKETAKMLDDNNIKYERQKRFKWLGLQSLDFYLPYHNIAIECQGKQHFKPISFSGKKEHIFNELKKNIKRDMKKIKLCEENNIKLLHYTTVKYPNDFILYKIITDKDELLNIISTHLSTI